MHCFQAFLFRAQRAFVERRYQWLRPSPAFKHGLLLVSKWCWRNMWKKSHAGQWRSRVAILCFFQIFLIISIRSVLQLRRFASKKPPDVLCWSETSKNAMDRMEWMQLAQESALRTFLEDHIFASKNRILEKFLWPLKEWYPDSLPHLCFVNQRWKSSIGSKWSLNSMVFRNTEGWCKKERSIYILAFRIPLRGCCQSFALREREQQVGEFGCWTRSLQGGAEMWVRS